MLTILTNLTTKKNLDMLYVYSSKLIWTKTVWVVLKGNLNLDLTLKVWNQNQETLSERSTVLWKVCILGITTRIQTELARWLPKRKHESQPRQN